MKKLTKLLSGTALALALGGGFGSAHADLSISSAFNSAGYDVITFTTPTGLVNMKYTGGHDDSVISLFDSSGKHLATNDDSDGAPSDFYSSLTRQLTAGSYSLLVTYYGTSLDYIFGAEGATRTDSDGYSDGSFYIGGTGTLSGLQAYLDANPDNSGAPYALTIAIPTAIQTANAVPEPAALTLAALGLAGLGIVRRKRS